MPDPNAWHNRDSFWELFEPVLFDEQRQANAAAELDHAAHLLQLRPGERILDLCCGTGRHSLELARRGYAVVGVDRTVSFIEKAQNQAREAQLAVDFVVSDMQAYCQPGSFDVVLNLFGSFGYFADPEDDRQVVRNMFATLRPGGRFLIETMGKEIAARGFQEREWSEQGDTLVLAERKAVQHWSRIQTRWIVIKGQERVEHHVSVRSYSAVELSALLVDGGFGMVQVYGNLAGRAYDHEAQRLVVVGTR